MNTLRLASSDGSMVEGPARPVKPLSDAEIYEKLAESIYDLCALSDSRSTRKTLGYLLVDIEDLRARAADA